ncbi:carbohydrate ABC transporter permease [Clostridium tarantellae]|uniref:ABC transporter permease subunit n=1 Tax=Clostridium tarantellae TaxID=39493 RepID=A0A6I1MW70_9CLOT|nr:carbohydrate ABC transporter permease [Clostridium tarantellae]MPQ44419.1 ABC transporter permease subunit [Clostridium tarantellae]
MFEKIFGKEFKRQNSSDKIFDITNYLVLLLILLAVLYPLYFIIIASFSDPNAVARGDVWLFPVGFNVDGYKEIFKNNDIWMGYTNSIKYTIIGTFVNIILTVPAAFALSRKELVGRKVFMSLITFTMFFGGGLIPTYLLVSNLGLYDTMWALILPGAVSVFNLIVTRTYFVQNIPEELFEAAQVDGCSYFSFFVKIVIPVSKPIIAVMVLMYAVGHWNSYFNALIYIRDRNLYPLQVILRELLIQQEAAAGMAGDAISAAEQQRIADMLKYGIIIVSSLPVLCMYPFVQKYFVKGMMIGSVKG